MPRRNEKKALTSAAQKLGSRGGKKGGPARAKALSRGERSKIAAKGAKAKNTKYSGTTKPVGPDNPKSAKPGKSGKKK